MLASIKSLLLGLLLGIAAASVWATDGTKPMRVVIQVSDDDASRWNLVLNNARNVQKEVGKANVEVEVVAYGPGLGILRDDSVVANRVQEALTSGIRFVACRNTMQAQRVTEAQMVPGIGYAQAGVVEIIKKQQEGWAYLRP